MKNPTKLIKARPEGFWTSTGIQILEGDKLRIKYVRGNWRSNPHWITDDAAGHPQHLGHGNYLLLGAPQGALIGKVGGDNHGNGSAPFLVGNSSRVPEGLTGTLWLTVNDEPAGFGDNSGEIKVEFEYF